MFNLLLRRLPDEVHRSTWFRFDETTQTHETTGEVFYYAYDAQEINSQTVAMRSMYTNTTLGLIVQTSSEIPFTVGDKVEIRGVKKLITDIGTNYLTPDHQLSIDFQPNINIYYRTLVLG